MHVYVGVEGMTDLAVANAILDRFGISSGGAFGLKGRAHLLQQLPAWNRSAVHIPWLVVVDLDRAPCPVDAVREWLPSPERNMHFRIAVREVEAWLLGDRESAAKFLGVSAAKITLTPEELPHPKEHLVGLARHSRRRVIRDGLVPRSGSKRTVGATYVSDIAEFAGQHWRPDVASRSCPSLGGLLRRLQEAVERESNDDSTRKV